jgi:hypothetical protein
VICRNKWVNRSIFFQRCAWMKDPNITTFLDALLTFLVWNMEKCHKSFLTSEQRGTFLFSRVTQCAFENVKNYLRNVINKLSIWCHKRQQKVSYSCQSGVSTRLTSASDFLIAFWFRRIAKAKNVCFTFFNGSRCIHPQFPFPTFMQI